MKDSMKIFKILIINLFLMTFITSCNSKHESYISDTYISVEREVTTSKIDDDNDTEKNDNSFKVLEGISLEEAELKIDLTDKVEFLEPNQLYPISLTTTTENRVINVTSHMDEITVNGKYTQVLFFYPGTNDIALEGQLLYALQAFSNKGDISKNIFVIAGNKYDYAEIKESIMFTDDRWIVVNVLNVINETFIEEEVACYKKACPQLDYEWMIELNDILEVQLPKILDEKNL